jgi:leucine dehydrogenase
MNDLIRNWLGESLVVRHDQQTGTWVFIAIHSTVLGSAMGGCRMRVYESPEEGLQDAMQISQAMTYTWAAIGYRHGGGKTVLAIPGEMDAPVRIGLFRRVGRLLESLRGTFTVSEGFGTTPEDIAVISEETGCVSGSRSPGERAIDSGPYTALGVFSAITAAARHALGTEDLTGRTVLIQGVGDVGEPLARRLKAAGAEILVCDLDDALARRVASELEGEAVEPHLAYARKSDVYAPCAIGRTLNAETIPQLNCKIVAGAAHNQLHEPGDADLLHERGILYAPDFIVNAGAALALPLLDAGDLSEEQVRNAVQRIGDTLHQIFIEADGLDESPVRAATRMAIQKLDQAR